MLEHDASPPPKPILPPELNSSHLFPCYAKENTQTQENERDIHYALKSLVDEHQSLIEIIRWLLVASFDTSFGFYKSFFPSPREEQNYQPTGANQEINQRQEENLPAYLPIDPFIGNLPVFTEFRDVKQRQDDHNSHENTLYVLNHEPYDFCMFPKVLELDLGEFSGVQPIPKAVCKEEQNDYHNVARVEDNDLLPGSSREWYVLEHQSIEDIVF